MLSERSLSDPKPDIPSACTERPFMAEGCHSEFNVLEGSFGSQAVIFRAG
jgi:hypothetical protein